MLKIKRKFKEMTSSTLVGCLLVLLLLIFNSNTNAQVCSGSLGNPVLTETFGTGIRADLNTTTSGTSTYCYEDGTGSDCVADTNSYMTCNEMTLYSGDAADLNIFWVTGGDHTGDSLGMMAVFNADFEANEFYRRSVDNLCGGTVFEFAAWIANLYDPMNTPGPCFDNNGDGLYPNVTFEIRNSLTDALIASIATGNVLPTSDEGLPNNIQWKQFGLTFQMPIGLSSIDIVMRNNGDGGCGNDLAIDDITLRSCGPTAEISLESELICLNQQTTFNAIIGDGLTDPYILWESWNSDTELWETLDIEGFESDGFDQIVLSELELDDSIRFIVAGDDISIFNTNCAVSSEIYTADSVLLALTPTNDTISIELQSQATIEVCIDNQLELLGNIESVFICNEPENLTYEFSQIGETLCFDFTNADNVEGVDELCVIVCDDFACEICDTTVIQLNNRIVVDTSGCFVPNVLTPNGDGLNDFLIIDCLDYIDGALLKVYNRWGNEVYSNENYKNDWNGYYNSKPLPDGTYYYIVQIENSTNNTINISGDLTILQ